MTSQELLHREDHYNIINLIKKAHLSNMLRVPLCGAWLFSTRLLANWSGFITFAVCDFQLHTLRVFHAEHLTRSDSVLAIIAAFRAFCPNTNFPPEKQSRQCRNKELYETPPTPCVFFFLSLPPSCWLIHLSRFIAELNIHHLYSLSRLLRYLQRFTQLKSEVNMSVLIGSFLVGILPYGQFPWKW